MTKKKPRVIRKWLCKCGHKKEHHTRKKHASIIGCNVHDGTNLCKCKLHYGEIILKEYVINELGELEEVKKDVNN